jgi:transposase
MRATSLLRRILGYEGVVVTGCRIDDGNVIAEARPSWRTPRCSGCNRKTKEWQLSTEGRMWRHLDVAGVQLFLEYDRKRVNCKTCGWLVEAVPWAADPRARFTREFDELIAFLAQRCDKSSIEWTFGIAWRTVGRCIERVVERLSPSDPLEGLTAIGVDEISYRKHHRYLTLVTNHKTGKVVWAKEGKNADVLKAFFEELGEDRCKKIEVVTADLSAAYRKAVEEVLPHARLVYDRFHVQRLVSDAVDETRRQEWRDRRDRPAEAAAVKKTRWALLKRTEKLTDKEQLRLARLQKENKRLYRAYLLKEQFVEIMDRRDPDVAREQLDGWLAWATRSRLPAFVKVAKTIRSNLEGILAYVGTRMTNGLIEGLNTKARLVTRRAYGFHSAAAVIAMIMLCCTGIDVRPPFHYAT